jgi:hypothetical protein
VYCSSEAPCATSIPIMTGKTRYKSRSFLQRQKVITSKSSSKNLSNVNTHTICFQRIGIFIHFLSGKQQKLRFFDVFFDVIIDRIPRQIFRFSKKFSSLSFCYFLLLFARKFLNIAPAKLASDFWLSKSNFCSQHPAPFDLLGEVSCFQLL